MCWFWKWVALVHELGELTRRTRTHGGNLFPQPCKYGNARAGLQPLWAAIELQPHLSAYETSSAGACVRRAAHAHTHTSADTSALNKWSWPQSAPPVRRYKDEWDASHPPLPPTSKWKRVSASVTCTCTPASDNINSFDIISVLWRKWASVCVSRGALPGRAV